jgi:CelD/BcsL family acetyltransferase involved in cellulose biosynthesis
MNVELLPAAALSAQYQERWNEIRRSNPDLASPFFHPEFTLAVARTHEDVEVAVVDEGGQAIGFFPFHRRRFRYAKPVGGHLSDYHGLIVAPGVQVDARELLRACNLAVWPFDHVLASQSMFEEFAEVRTESPIIDLRDGFQAYVDSRKRTGSNRISQMQRKARKIAREVGPVRLEVHVDDPRMLEQIIRWKSEQCCRTGNYDFFSEQAAVRLVRDIATTKVDGFEGLVSVLYAGDSIAAAHMGMRADQVLHWWFPAYERSLGRYSPGGILLIELAREIAELGVTTLDLGKGDDPYKASFMTGSVPLIEGAVDVPSAAALARRTRIRAERWVRCSPVMEPIRQVIRRVRRKSSSQLQNRHRGLAGPHRSPWWV